MLQIKYHSYLSIQNSSLLLNLRPAIDSIPDFPYSIFSCSYFKIQFAIRFLIRFTAIFLIPFFSDLFLICPKMSDR